MRIAISTLLVFISCNALWAQTFSTGHTTITFTDATRNNRSIAAEVYYPADADGENVPLAVQGGTFPVVVFGHGFVMVWSAYENIWTPLTENGFIAVFPTTESGFSPNHTEFGKDIAGLDRNAQQELEQLRREVRMLRTDLSEAQSVANTSDSLLIAERSAQAQLMMQIRQLQTDNEVLRSDLGFFERLIPGSGNDALSIRGLQAERLSETQLKWQVLMIQASKNAPDFKGALEVTFTGTLAGKPWTLRQAPTPQSVIIKGYLRMEGVVDVPAQAVVENVTAKILQGNSVRSMQSFNL